MKGQIYSFTRANGRTENQDYLFYEKKKFSDNEEITILGVCDGMGGMEKGKEISRLTAWTFGAYFSRKILTAFAEEGSEILSLRGIKTVLEGSVGAVHKTISAYMKELDEELWKLGVLAKTKHNEVAPSQHELAPIFTSTNVATDHNQLTMEMMKKVADRHGLACLLHEKPFDGVNGSGKHNNWSLSTNSGVNLLEPGDSPRENAQFLLFLTAVIKAVDEYQDLLRISVASAGNDHRLGANEAPPAIVSMFLGDELSAILDSIVEGKDYQGTAKEEMKVGVHILPRFPKDTTDRNRTSPFAFTGNKFEFRMLGSNFSIAGPNMVLNTIVAEELSQFADVLEQADDFESALNKLIKKTIKEHKRIIFNGNNYSEEWVKEAEKRGLLNLRTTVDALPHYIEPKNIKLFTKHKIFTESEMYSRYEILLENYCKTLHIEGKTMLDMIKKDIIPAVTAYCKELSETALSKKSLCPQVSCVTEESMVTILSELSAGVFEKTQKLEAALSHTEQISDIQAQAESYRDEVIPAMEALRKDADEIESLVGEKYWPYPTYGKMLFSV